MTMKLIKNLLGLLLVAVALISCQDEFSVELANRKFVRISKQAVSLTVGEKMTLKTTTDTLGSVSHDFLWSVADPSVATITAGEDGTAVITATAEGRTVIQVESTDGELKYFTDLSVTGERVIKILAIGNSFSEDAVENYLHDLADAAGYKLLIANMYIGGCNLETHWKNASGDLAAYQLRTISPDGTRGTMNEQALKEVIAGENWDYISFQEVSQLSGKLEGYTQYLPQLVEYAAALTTNPDVRFILHQTWAYAQDSNHFGFPDYNSDQMTMFQAIVETVWQAKNLTNIDRIIPSGTAIQNARTSYIGDRFTRDGYHLSLTMGRFTAASTWFEALFGGIADNPFIPDMFSVYDSQLAKTAALEAVSKPTEVTPLTDFRYPEPNLFELTAPLFIDFGGVESPAPFNNFRHPNDQKIIGLKDINGANSNFAMEVTESFTGTLSRGLQNVLDMPRSASEDMFFSDGKFIPQSGLMLSNLNRNQKYTLVFYGSINDNRTETMFEVAGATQGVASLDNDNNLGRLAVVEGIQPAEDATIQIKVKPGPNNNHWNLFFGVNVMMLLPEGMPVPVEPSSFELKKPVFVDFGQRVAGTPFYLFDRPTDAPRYDLTDQDGTNTGYAMSITSRFSGENQSGTFTNLLGLPGEVTVDAFWSNRDNPESQVTLYRLNPSQQYQFHFFGSRNGVSDNRETTYTVRGLNEGSGSLNASNNNSEVVTVNGIQPYLDGTVDVVVTAGPNNNNGDKYYYINAMFISPDGYLLPGM
ncbi:MAG: DUF4886 domain-containing protein [Spirochaetia bacterium]|nr:DUF4886 domain-containing protein [Spirochaetia bacterium]